jgi:hypothetical protein
MTFSRRAVQKIPKLEARCSKNSQQTRGALFKNQKQKMPKIEARSSKQKNIPKPSIGQNLQLCSLS